MPWFFWWFVFQNYCSSNTVKHQTWAGGGQYHIILRIASIRDPYCALCNCVLDLSFQEITKNPQAIFHIACTSMCFSWYMNGERRYNEKHSHFENQMDFFLYLLTYLYVSKRNEQTCVEEIERLKWGIFYFQSATVAKVFVVIVNWLKLVKLHPGYYSYTEWKSASVDGASKMYIGISHFFRQSIKGSLDYDQCLKSRFYHSGNSSFPVLDVGRLAPLLFLN